MMSLFHNNYQRNKASFKRLFLIFSLMQVFFSTKLLGASLFDSCVRKLLENPYLLLDRENFSYQEEQALNLMKEPIIQSQADSLEKFSKNFMSFQYVHKTSLADKISSISFAANGRDLWVASFDGSLSKLQRTEDEATISYRQVLEDFALKIYVDEKNISGILRNGRFFTLDLESKVITYQTGSSQRVRKALRSYKDPSLWLILDYNFNLKIIKKEATATSQREVLLNEFASKKFLFLPSKKDNSFKIAYTLKASKEQIYIRVKSFSSASFEEEESFDIDLSDKLKGQEIFDLEAHPLKEGLFLLKAKNFRSYLLKTNNEKIESLKILPEDSKTSFKSSYSTYFFHPTTSELGFFNTKLNIFNYKLPRTLPPSLVPHSFFAEETFFDEDYSSKKDCKFIAISNDSQNLAVSLGKTIYFFSKEGNYQEILSSLDKLANIKDVLASLSLMNQTLKMNETEDSVELETLYEKSKYLIKHFAIEPEILKRCKKIATYCLPSSLKKKRSENMRMEKRLDQLLVVNHRALPKSPSRSIKRGVAEIDTSIAPSAETQESPKGVKRKKLF